MTMPTTTPTVRYEAPPRGERAASGQPDSSFRQLLRVEMILFWRSAAAVVWTALLPVAALVVLGAIPATRRPAGILHGISYLDAYLPILMCFALFMSSANFLPPTLAQYREGGFLRRLSTTPVPPSRLLGAQATIYLGIATAVCGTLVAVAVLAYDVPAPRQGAGLVLAVALTGAAMTAIGLLVAAVAPSAKVANALSMVLFPPLMFLAGLWLPRAQMPAVLRRISDYSPLGAGVRAVQDSIAGHFPTGASLLVLVAYAVVCFAVAARAFRWE
jgi:ABC-2 type transport system permease protein